MANKKVSQLVSKPSVLVTDLFPIADPTTGQLYKTTISDLGTAIGSGVSSVNGLVGAVVLDTDDIQELASPTNRWFTDTRARAALSASSPLAYNSGTGVFSIPQANGSTNGFLSSADWTTFNAKQPALSGTGFVKISGTTISYDNSTYLTTSGAASTYLALSGGTLTGALNGTSATFSGDVTLSATNPRLYFTDTDNNPDYFISNTDGTFTVYDVTNSTSRFTIGTTGNGTFGGNLTVGQIIRSGGTSAQFLKADGSVDSTSYQPTLTNPVTGTGTSGIVAKFSGTSAIADSIIYDNGTRVSIGANITTTNTFTSVSSTSSAYAVVAQASSSANGIWSNVLGTGEIFRGQTSGGSYFIINNGGNAFLNGNLNVGDFASTSFRLNVVGTANITGALSGTSATFSTGVSATNGYGFTSSLGSENITFSNSWFGGIDAIYQNSGNNNDFGIYLNGGTSTQAKLYITNAGAATFSSSVSATSVALNGSIANSADAATLTIKQTSTSYNNGIYLERGGERNGYHMYIGGAVDSLTFRRNYFGTQSDVMSLTRDGNVGIGTTAPSTYLHGASSGMTLSATTTYSSSTTKGITLESTTGSTDVGTGIWFNNGQLYSGIAGARSNSSNWGTDLRFFTHPDSTTNQYDLTERMRITSGGNLLVGTTTSDAGRVQIQGSGNGSIYGHSLLLMDSSASKNALLISHRDGETRIMSTYGGSPGVNSDMTFWTTQSNGNQGERMRITSSGNLLVNRTSDNGLGKLQVNGDVYWFNLSAGSAVSTLKYNTSSGLMSFDTSARIFKKDITNLNYGLNEVLKMSSKQYKWKSNNLEDIGFIADEMYSIIPEIVFLADNKINKTELKDGEPMGINYDRLVPVLVKAIQELKAELDTLKNK